MNLAGQMERRMHDWELYLQSELEQDLQIILCMEGKQYRLYGDSGYSTRSFLYVKLICLNISFE